MKDDLEAGKVGQVWCCCHGEEDGEMLSQITLHLLSKLMKLCGLDFFKVPVEIHARLKDRDTK